MSFPLGLKRAATLCILKHQDQFLLLKRNKDPHKDKYTPVGGKIDPFESPLAAAIRETFEETGIQLDHMKYCGLLTETSPVKYNWICYVYLAEIPHQPPPPCNEGILKWIDFEGIAHIPTPTTDAIIYQYVMEGKAFSLDAIYDKDLKLMSMKEEMEEKMVFQQS